MSWKSAARLSLLLLPLCVTAAPPASAAPVGKVATTLPWSKLNGKIMNGKVVSKRNAPITRLVFNKGADLCTSSVIAPYFVLTAAHCIVGKHEDAWVEINGQKVGIAWWKAHPNFAEIERGDGEAGIKYDLGVVRLAKRTAVKPLPIIAKRAPRKGGKAFVLGFGFTLEEENPEDAPLDQLRAGKITVDDTTVYEILSNYRPTESAICYGDSGGSLLGEYTDETGKHIGLLGVISNFATNATTEKADISDCSGDTREGLPSSFMRLNSRGAYYFIKKYARGMVWK